MTRKKQEQLREGEPPTTGLPAIPAGAGLERLGPEDLIIPRLVLVQPMSRIEGAEPGKFYLNLTGEQFDRLEAVFLKVAKGRVYFADATERKPACGSSDRLTPSPRFDTPMARSCTSCALARWNGKEPPSCNETYNLLGVMTETELPFWWSVKSTGIAPTRRFLSAIALRARLGKNLYDAQVTMTSQLVSLPGKKYHVPVYTVTWLKEAARYRDLYRQFAQEEIDPTLAAEEEASQEGVDAEGFDWKSGRQVN